MVTEGTEQQSCRYWQLLEFGHGDSGVDIMNSRSLVTEIRVWECEIGLGPLTILLSTTMLIVEN